MIKSAKTLILTPNKNEMCGMYQLAKDLAKELNGDIMTNANNPFPYTFISRNYDEVISFLYPMHRIAKRLTKFGLKWICYDQKIPPVTKFYFPNFWRRQAMRYIAWRNKITMQGADEYWDVTEREQKPRWTEKTILSSTANFDYAIYLGRTTDYKNFDWLKTLMKGLDIPLFYFKKPVEDDEINIQLSNAKMLVTASLWEGYGRGVAEAEALGIPAVAYDVGAHKRHIKKGICVPLDINDMKKSEQLFKEAVIKIWQSNQQN